MIINWRSATYLQRQAMRPNWPVSVRFAIGPATAVPADRLEYTIPPQRFEYTIPSQRLEYTVTR